MLKLNLHEIQILHTAFGYGCACGQGHKIKCKMHEISIERISATIFMNAVPNRIGIVNILVLTTSCNFFLEMVTVAFDETVDVVFTILVVLPAVLLDTVKDMPNSFWFNGYDLEIYTHTHKYTDADVPLSPKLFFAAISYRNRK